MQESGNNILFVTNEDEIVNQLSDQLILLRNIDCILIRLYTDACESIDKEKPQSIIITCSNREEEAECIETIKLMKHHTIVPIILVLREYNEDFVKLANQAGISDCLTVEFGHSEILMRTIWSLQKNELDYIKDNNIDAILMGIKPNKNSGLKITKECLDLSVKNNVRGSDVVIMQDEETYFLILNNTNLSGSMIVWSRILKAVGAENVICGCVTPIEGKDYEQLQEFMLNGLEIALTAPNNFLTINDDDDSQDSDDWLAQKGKSHNLKLFKNIFSKKLKTTIKPIFEFSKKTAKRKLPKYDFEIIEENLAIKLVVTKKDKISTLEILHDGGSYINVNFIHEGLDSPENKNTKLELNEITESIIKDTIDIFLNEYLSYANH